MVPLRRRRSLHPKLQLHPFGGVIVADQVDEFAELCERKMQVMMMMMWVKNAESER